MKREPSVDFHDQKGREAFDGLSEICLKPMKYNYINNETEKWEGSDPCSIYAGQLLPFSCVMWLWANHWGGIFANKNARTPPEGDRHATVWWPECLSCKLVDHPWLMINQPFVNQKHPSSIIPWPSFRIIWPLLAGVLKKKQWSPPHMPWLGWPSCKSMWSQLRKELPCS